MSKLTIVRQSLERNPDVIIVHIYDYVNTTVLSYRHDMGGWGHTVDCVVAPRSGLYTGDELQRFMMGLVPIEPTMTDDFAENEYGINFGKLYFDEPIGPVRKTTSLEVILEVSDEELKNSDRLFKRTVGDETHEGHMRRIWVSPYPNEIIARAALQEDPYVKNGIMKEDLARYKGSLVKV